MTPYFAIGLFIVLSIVVLGIAAVWFFLVLLTGIPIVYFSQRFRRRPVIEPVDLASETFADYQKFAAITDSLEKEGLRPAGDFALSIMSSGKMHSRVFYDASGSILGHLARIQTKNATALMMEFASEFEDGAQVNTLNSSAPHGFSLRKNQFLRQYPLLAPDLLLRAHRHHLEFFGRSRTLKNIGDQEAGRRLAISLERELTQQVKSGMLDLQGEYYRLTWKGAFILVAKQWLYMVFRYNPLIARDSFARSLRARRDRRSEADFKLRFTKFFSWKIFFLAVIVLTVNILMMKRPDGGMAPGNQARYNEVIAGVLSGRLQPDANGVARLATSPSAGPYGKEIYVTKMPGGATVILFPVWRGKGSDLLGFLYSDRALTAADMSTDGRGKSVIRINGPVVAGPPGSPAENRIDALIEKRSEKWYAVSYHQD